MKKNTTANDTALLLKDFNHRAKNKAYENFGVRSVGISNMIIEPSFLVTISSVVKPFISLSSSVKSVHSLGLAELTDRDILLFGYFLRNIHYLFRYDRGLTIRNSHIGNFTYKMYRGKYNIQRFPDEIDCSQKNKTLNAFYREILGNAVFTPHVYTNVSNIKHIVNIVSTLCDNNAYICFHRKDADFPLFNSQDFESVEDGSKKEYAQRLLSPYVLAYREDLRDFLAEFLPIYRDNEVFNISELSLLTNATAKGATAEEFHPYHDDNKIEQNQIISKLAAII